MTLKDTIECMNRIDKPLDRITEIYEHRTIEPLVGGECTGLIIECAYPPDGRHPHKNTKTEQ